MIALSPHKSVEDSRVQRLNNLPSNDQGQYILYWMQASVRLEDNHALAYALNLCRQYQQPLVVFFCLTPSYPHANLRHYTFLLEGLEDVAKKLKEKSISFCLRIGEVVDEVEIMAEQATVVVTDVGATRHQRIWREKIATSIKQSMLAIESNLLIPLWVTSNKEEYAARTIRPKIEKIMEQWITPRPRLLWSHGQSSLNFQGKDIAQWQTWIAHLPIDVSVGAVDWCKGGESAALKRLKSFIKDKLINYHQDRSNPALDASSRLSPYLHFGHLSPLTILREVQGHKESHSFIEELIVRRELAFNFCWYNSYYDQWRGLPQWAIESLESHQSDDRPILYTLEQLEKAMTHDPYWNAAQKEMALTGFMHGYMRMYWGKKIIEWTKNPQQAFEWMITLNDKYQLDGRDPNSYCGIAWCFGKHDRPWSKRNIFGTIRYMNAEGLKRKFDMKKYIERIEGLENGKD